MKITIRHTKAIFFLIAILTITDVTFSFPSFPVNSQAAEDEYTTHLPLVFNNYDPLWQWAPDFPITLQPRPNNTPVSVMDQAGQFHIFWDTLASGQRYIYHAWLTSAGWTTPAPIANSLGYSYLLFQPVVGADGHIHILWRTYLGASVENPHRLLYARFDGQGWTAIEEVYSSSSEMQGMVRLDTQGRPHVTMMGTLVFSNILHTQRTESGWAAPANAKPAHSVSLIWPDMAGGIHLYGHAYNYSTGVDDVQYSYWRNGDFLVSGQRTPGELSGYQTLLDGVNNLHTFKTGQVPVPGGTVTGVTYRCLDSQLKFGPASVLTGQTDISYSLSKTWDQGTRVGLAWKETVSGNIRFVVWSGCQPQAEGRVVPLPAGESWEVSTIALQPDPFKACLLAKTAGSQKYSAICTGGQ